METIKLLEQYLNCIQNRDIFKTELARRTMPVVEESSLVNAILHADQMADAIWFELMGIKVVW